MTKQMGEFRAHPSSQSSGINPSVGKSLPVAPSKRSGKSAKAYRIERDEALEQLRNFQASKSLNLESHEITALEIVLASYLKDRQPSVLSKVGDIYVTDILNKVRGLK